MTAHGAFLGSLPYALRYAILIPPFMYVGYRATGRNRAGAVVTLLIALGLAVSNGGAWTAHQKASATEWVVGVGLALMIIVDFTGARRQGVSIWTGRRR